jgi:hypothetical protein
MDGRYLRFLLIFQRAILSGIISNKTWKIPKNPNPIATNRAMNRKYLIKRRCPIQRRNVTCSLTKRRRVIKK